MKNWKRERIGRPVKSQQSASQQKGSLLIMSKNNHCRRRFWFIYIFTILYTLCCVQYSRREKHRKIVLLNKIHSIENFHIPRIFRFPLTHIAEEIWEFFRYFYLFFHASQASFFPLIPLQFSPPRRRQRELTAEKYKDDKFAGNQSKARK